MLHQIGVGALGPVFRTYEPTRDRLVAVKAFRLDIVPEQAQALADELSRAAEAGLFHPSIVEPIAAGVEGTLAYRAEEYVAAESLDVAMRHYAPAPLEKALPFITQLAGAIDFARAAGVGHGALHPRDIFVTPDEARATGFGVVEALERIGIRAPVRRPYSAPERIAGADWSTPADVFALAAIAFELLTARRPSGTGPQIGSIPRDAGDHADAIQAVLARAMDDDPARRYPSALAFASALESAARGQSITDAVATVNAIATTSPESLVAGPESRVASPESRVLSPESRVTGPESRVTGPESRVTGPESRGTSDESLAAGEDARDADTARTDTGREAFLMGAAYGAVSETTRQTHPSETPGEFEIEERLDPLHAAIEDESIAEPRRLEFDEPPTAPTVDVPLGRGDDGERFADDFVEAQQAQADARRPLEASYETDAETAPVYTPAEPAYATTGSVFQGDAADVPERSRPAILPIAVTLVLGLLAGFAAGYFVGSRDRGAPEATVTESTTDAGGPSGAAPTAGARQWSEQAVTGRTPSPASKAAPPTEPPAVPDESGSAPAARASGPAPRPEPAVTRGQIVVRSTPSRANVTINGRWRGRTPLTLDDLPLGNYAVRVVQEGYDVAREDVPLTAKSAQRTVDLRLQRSARATAAAPAAAPRQRPATSPRPPAAAPSAPETFTGELFVDSRPQGASVLLDGKLVGKTPLRLPAVAIGSHVVRLELAEHKPWFSTTRITSGEVSRVTGSLERFQDQ